MAQRKLILGVALLVAAGLIAVAWSSTIVREAVKISAAGEVPKGGHLIGLYFTQWGTQTQLELGDRFYWGKGLPVDKVEAAYWYRRAADGGSRMGEFLLGRAYQYGAGVPLDLPTALSLNRKAADHGLALAMMNVARFYRDGVGVPKSAADSFAWFQRAAEAGDRDGQVILAIAYFDGDGTNVDFAQAAKWARKSADQGSGDAQLFLSSLYAAGQGVPQDDQEAQQWLKKSADSGNARAEFTQGAYYFEGTGVGQDKAKAFEYFQKAARQGQSGAQNALGQIYQYSDYSIPSARQPNWVVAYAYYNLAAIQSDKVAVENKKTLEAMMTGDQLKAAQSLATNWKEGSLLDVTMVPEDLAPQEILGYNGKPDTYKNTRVWFSKAFSVSGQNFRSVFLVSKGEDDCHVCRAHVSVVTYKANKTSWDPDPMRQANFTDLGSWGDVPALKNPGAAFDSPDRIDLGVIPSNAGIGVRIPSSYSAQGETGSFEDVLLYDHGQWINAGLIDTGDSDVDTNCTHLKVGQSPGPQEYPCYEWSGTAEIGKALSHGWPNIVVKSRGTRVVEKTFVLEAATDSQYSFNGKVYGLAR